MSEAQDYFSQAIEMGRQIEAEKVKWTREILQEHLRKKGFYYLCHCPFHSEKTASGIYDALSDDYHCFSCGKNCDGYELARMLSGGEEDAFNKKCETGNCGF
jgi:hypothetical protein